MPTINNALRKVGLHGKPKAHPPTALSFSNTIQIERSPDAIVIASGDSVTVTYNIMGSGTTTASLIRTDGTSPVSLTCDGSDHTVNFSPTLSQLYFISASDVNGSCIDRLEIIVQHTLTASDPTASATIATVRSGLWIDTNPATSPWPSGTLPGVNDIVSNAFTVKVNARRDGGGSILQCARFINQSGGILRIWNDASVSAALWVTDYVGQTGSVLDMDSTYTPGVVAVLLMRNRPFHANDTSGNSPDGYASYWNAVDIRGGDLTMRGTLVTPYSRAAGDIAQGATYIDLQSAVTGWAQSFLLVIPDTRGTRASDDFTDQLEVVVVRGVGPDGLGNANRRVYLVRPTVWAHPMARNVDGTPAIRTWDSVPLTAHVVCQSKTCGIITEDPTGISTLGGQPRAHMLLNGGGRVDCRDAMVSHGMGRCTQAQIDPRWDHNPSYSAQEYRLFPLYTYDLHGPSGGLGYDATVDEPEFQPANGANIYSLDGPSHRFVRCLALDPYEDNGTSGPPVSVGINLLTHGAIGGWVHFFTNYGLYKDNIGFNFSGTCWGIGDGTVQRNLFTGNIVMRTDGRGNRLDVNGLLAQGTGWLFGTYANWFRFNISADAGGLQNNHTQRIDQYSFGSINVPSLNDNFDSDNPLHYMAWVPNFQGASLLNAAQRTGIDNAPSEILEWRDNEGYGAGRHMVPYTLGTAGSLATTVTSDSDQTMLRQTCWGVFHFAVFPYGNYRFVRDSWFCRADYAQAPGFDVNTDYQQCEVVYKDFDMEGYSALVTVSDQYGTQHDADQPDIGAPGRLMIRGGRFKVDRLVYFQLSNSSSNARDFYGVNIVIGGDRSTGSSADIVTVLSPTGGDPKFFYMGLQDITHFNNFQYVIGQNLTSPKSIQVNRLSGNNYDVYPWVQNPDQVLPQSYDATNSPPQLATATTWGCPEAGMTNQQCHDKYLPLPSHIADVTQTLYRGVLKVGQPDASTPGMCWGNKLTPGTATIVTWIDGPLGTSSARADQVS